MRFPTSYEEAKAPARRGGSYVKVAVLEVEDDVKQVSMISERAVGVIRIVEEWGPSYLGKTSRSAGRRDEIEAHELARRLNCPLMRLATAAE